MTDQWRYVDKLGDWQEPVSAEVLKQLAAEGEIYPDTRVLPAEKNDRGMSIRADTIEGITFLFQNRLLEKCPICKAVRSREARACPGCGHPNRNPSNDIVIGAWEGFLGGVAVIVMILSLMALMGGIMAFLGASEAGENPELASKGLMWIACGIGGICLIGIPIFSLSLLYKIIRLM